MKGDPKVIEHLNKALKLELTTVNQYFLHARMFRDWGFAKIAKIEYEESIDEMKHADALAHMQHACRRLRLVFEHKVT